ncbi:MAG: hypothetical protein JWM16_3374 [Verrucomicrobiales bacterium]|nr:hypothetical protein [Verrucomicrobiales bacterium]
MKDSGSPQTQTPTEDVLGRPSKPQQNLPRIPTPFRQRAREFRIRILPILAFGFAVFGVVKLMQVVGQSGLPGIAEGPQALVHSPRAGILAVLNVRQFQRVEAGMEIGTILIDDPRGQLEIVQAGLELARLQLQPSIPDKNAFNYERLRLEASVQKTALGLAKVNLERAEPALKRNAELRKDHLISEDVYELSLRDRDFYRAEIEERKKTLQEVEERLRVLAILGQSETVGTNLAMLHIVSTAQADLASVSSNIVSIKVFAPMSGLVRRVWAQQGESVILGAPLLSIESDQSERIVAYLRQPYNLQPEVGMHVKVASRNPPKERFDAQIAHIGPRMEAITNVLAMTRIGFVDLGLAIIVDVPSNVKLRPGEIVDVWIDSPSIQPFRNPFRPATNKVNAASATRL